MTNDQIGVDSDDAFASMAPAVTAFEQIVLELKLQPDQYVGSVRLREWALQNKDMKYVPEQLLQAWNFKVRASV